jgi:pimeloyl-ACP methyl ester carboxylesterase
LFQPKLNYARNGDVNIAYQVIGEGPFDLLFIPAFVSHLDLYWAAPETAAFFRRLASFSRLILFDKRGTGLSDPVSEVGTLEDRIEDVHAVLDACDSRQAVVFGLSEGGPMSLLFAATYPERTTALVMFGAYARLVATDDYFPELRRVGQERLDAFRAALEHHWGEGEAIAMFMPSAAADGNALRTLGMFERAAASPAMVGAQQRFSEEIDVRQVLPVISIPTLVLHRTDDVVPVEYGRYIAEKVPGARFKELGGDDHLPWEGDSRAVLDEVEEFLTGVRHGGEPDRMLATVLFTDIAGSTERAAMLGDDRWRLLLENHDELVRSRLTAFKGREIKTLGDGFLATFDGPGRAIRCACAIREDVGALGVDVRAAVHTGECEVMGNDIGGMAVHIGARVIGWAAPGDVLVTGAVRDLVVGSGFEFADRGTHRLKGVPGEWQLLEVAEARSDSEAVPTAKAADNPLSPNGTLVTRSDRTALQIARRSPGVARLVSRIRARTGSS